MFLKVNKNETFKRELVTKPKVGLEAFLNEG